MHWMRVPAAVMPEMASSTPPDHPATEPVARQRDGPRVRLPVAPCCWRGPMLLAGDSSRRCIHRRRCPAKSQPRRPLTRLQLGKRPVGGVLVQHRVREPARGHPRPDPGAGEVRVTRPQHGDTGRSAVDRTGTKLPCTTAAPRAATYFEAVSHVVGVHLIWRTGISAKPSKRLGIWGGRCLETVTVGTPWESAYLTSV